MLKKTLLFCLCLILSSCLNYIENEPPHQIKFLNKPCLKPHDGYRYMLCNDMDVEIDNVIHTVPEGFDTDFASIPQYFWWRIAPYEATLAAPSLLHDYQYACPGNQSRRYADNVFYSALLENGVSGGHALKLYYAVRFAGAPFFKKGRDCAIDLDD